MISQNVKMNLNIFFMQMIAHYTLDNTLSTCVLGENIMDFAKQIKNNPKCLNGWLK